MRIDPRTWSTGARAAVAAGLIAGVLFTGFALWLRLAIADLNDTRDKAAEAGAHALADSIKAALVAGRPIPTDLDTRFEVVHSDGRVLAAGTDVQEFRQRTGHSIFQPPIADERAGRFFDFPQVTYESADGSTSWGDSAAFVQTVEEAEIRPGATGRIGIYVFVGYRDWFLLSDLDPILWPAVPAAALLVALVAWASASNALRPVEWIRVQAADVTARSLDQRVDVPIRRLGMGRLSIGVRAAVAAAIFAAGPMVVGIVWLRHIVDDVNTARHMSEYEAAWMALDAVATTAHAGIDVLPSIRQSPALLYELVYPDGRIDASPQIAEAERQAGGRLLAGERTRSYRGMTERVDQSSEARDRVRALVPAVSTPVNVVSRPVMTPTGQATVYAVEASPFKQNPAIAIDWVLYPTVPASMALIGFFAWFGTTRALRPVERIQAQAAEISMRSLDKRVTVPPSRDAISKLAVTLNETLDRLEKSVKAQRQFIADAAHELRSPIASLRTVLEVAADHPDMADWPAVMRDAVTDTRRLESLAEDLLLLARLDAALPLDSSEVDLSELVTTQINGDPRVQLDTNGRTMVRGDAKQLDRLLRNLVDNAKRHARETIKVTVRSTEDRSVLEVADDGPGIPPEDRERVFDRFTRLDEARDSDAGGAGLGLAIAREIAVRHGGTLTVGDNAVFTADFPRSQ